MGMFDYIKIEMPIPSVPEPPNVEWFQTKDVPTEQLYLEKWKITSDGRLVKLGVHYEDRSDKSAPPGSLERIAGIMTPVAAPELDQEVQFHGDISFGHYDPDSEKSWDYIARFTDGICVSIWCDEFCFAAPHHPARPERERE